LRVTVAGLEATHNDVPGSLRGPIEEDAFIFNVHVIGLNAGNDKVSGRVSIDPTREKIAGGLVRAPRITHGQANRQFR
jgi:hypothetical protein